MIIITVVHKSSPFKTYLIDITIPGDSRLHQKFVEKKERYSDLCIVLNRLWKTSCVLGSLGSVSVLSFIRLVLPLILYPPCRSQ